MRLKKKTWEQIVCLLLLTVNPDHQAAANTLTATITVDGTHLSRDGEIVLQKIKEYFPDAPYMVYVANCESTGLIHLEPDGRLLANKKGSTARGVFQILMRVHEPEMRKQGLDPGNIDDYLTYARQLYDAKKLTPWESTEHCWGDKVSS